MFLMNIPKDSAESRECETSRTDNRTSHSKSKSIEFYLKKARQMRSEQAWRLVKQLFKRGVKAKNGK